MSKKKEIILEFIILVVLTILLSVSLYWIVGGSIENTKKEEQQKMVKEMNLTYEKKNKFDEYNKFTNQIFEDNIIDKNESGKLYEIKKEISQYYEQENKFDLPKLSRMFGQGEVTGNDFDEILNRIKEIERNEFSNLEVTEFKVQTSTFFDEWTKYFDFKIMASKKNIEKPIDNFTIFLISITVFSIVLRGSGTLRKLKELKKTVV